MIEPMIEVFTEYQTKGGTKARAEFEKLCMAVGAVKAFEQEGIAPSITLALALGIRCVPLSPEQQAAKAEKKAKEAERVARVLELVKSFAVLTDAAGLCKILNHRGLPYRDGGEWSKRKVELLLREQRAAG